MVDDVVSNAHASIKKGSKSFALASRIFSPDMRNDAAMLYGWCRLCDDIVDGQIMGHGQVQDYRSGQQERLDGLYKKTRNALDGLETEDPIFQGLSRVFSTHNIPHKHAFELLDGFKMDANERVYTSMNSLLEYCYHVAGVVGVMMAHIMGVRDEVTLDRASDLGLAFQLTNIARDVIDDANADRVYLPNKILSSKHAPEKASEIADPKNWPQVFLAAEELLLEAEKYYQSAYMGIKELPFRSAWSILAALKVYRQIGETLKKAGPTAWEKRVSTPTHTKLWLATSAISPALTRKNTTIKKRQNMYQRPI